MNSQPLHLHIRDAQSDDQLDLFLEYNSSGDVLIRVGRDEGDYHTILILHRNGTISRMQNLPDYLGLSLNSKGEVYMSSDKIDDE